MDAVSVLVLNQNYEPLNVCNARRAFVLVDRGKAEILEHAEGVIRSTVASFPRPSVIRLIYMIRRPRPQMRLTRREVFVRDRYTCQYCGIQPGPEELTVDHVVPRSRGGVSSWENCVLACVECNKRKADRSPLQAGLKLRKAPKKPSWKSLVQVPTRDRRESWEKFLSRAYWEVELEP